MVARGAIRNLVRERDDALQRVRELEAAGGTRGQETTVYVPAAEPSIYYRVDREEGEEAEISEEPVLARDDGGEK